MKKYILPILLPFIIAFLTYCYDSYIGKYKSILLTCIFNLFAAIIATAIAYKIEGNAGLYNFKNCIKEPYFIPYIILLPTTYFIWFIITKNNGAAYAGLFESTYIMIFILASILLGNGNFNLKFIIGALFITTGVILIQKSTK